MKRSGWAWATHGALSIAASGTEASSIALSHVLCPPTGYLTPFVYATHHTRDDAAALAMALRD